MDFSMLDRHIANTYKRLAIPGCDIIIKQNHRIIFRKQYGYSDMDKETETRGDECYALYSCTKPMTVAGAMRLAEEGKIDLDAPVYDYLPFFKDCYILKDGKRKEPDAPITVKHLLTMTAGFDYDFDKPSFNGLFGGRLTVSSLDFAKAAVREPLIFEPGERFQYSICLDILGAVIEAVSQMPFSEYMKKSIFEPLGMQNTYFAADVQPNVHITPIYKYQADGRKVVHAQNDYLSHPFSRFDGGGAGVISTAEDYSKFADAMANFGTAENGYRLLKPETVAEIKKEQLKSFTVNCDFTCAAGEGYGYGLGMRTLVSRENGQKSPLGEFGWDGAAGSYILMDTQNRLSIVFTTHLLNWPSLLGTYHAPIRDLTYECLFGQ